MNILICPDKFKGSLSANEAAAAISSGIMSNNTTCHNIVIQPMADGGEGSLEILCTNLELHRRKVLTVDPLGRNISADYLSNSTLAVIELASASGLNLLEDFEKNPLYTSTYGTGLIIVDAIKNGAKEIVLLLGGSATNDAGMGICKALGFSFINTKGEILKPTGEHLAEVGSISYNNRYALDKIKFNLLCDVRNPLYGTNGAAQVYAGQKGADISKIELLDAGLKHYSSLLALRGNHIDDLPGAGAAGGVAGGLFALLDAKIESGFDKISQLVQLPAKIKAADLVISGEGRLDAQSFQGKVVDGVSDLCKRFDKPLVLMVGKNDFDFSYHGTRKFEKVLSIWDLCKDDERAMINASHYLYQLASQIVLPTT